MENLIEELKNIKNEKMCIFARTVKIKAISEKYNMFNSDVIDLYFSL